MYVINLVSITFENVTQIITCRHVRNVVHENLTLLMLASEYIRHRYM